MEFLNQWWGVVDDISPFEIAARAAVMSIITLVMIRLSGMRAFGKQNAFDMIITFLIGGVLSRGVVGATPFFSAVAGAIMLLLVHKILSKLSLHNRGFERAIKGHSYQLYKDDQFNHENMNKANMTEADIREELRIKLHTTSFEQVKEIYMEKTGEISFIKKA